MTTIYKKLLNAQQGFEKLFKNSKADRYRYADLPAVLDLIMPQLHNNGLFLHQKTSTADNAVIVETVVFDEEGNSLSGGQLSMPTAGLMQKGAQAFGSALTYARRYSLTAFFCLSAEDDDGNMATRANVEAQQRKQRQQPQPQPQELDLKKVEDGLRGCTTLKRLEALYQNAIHRADGNQTAQINAIYEQFKQSLNAGQG